MKTYFVFSEIHQRDGDNPYCPIEPYCPFEHCEINHNIL